MIHVGLITTIGRLRQPDPTRVAALIESIKEVGLLNPITVCRATIKRNGVDADGYKLIAGGHRLEACKKLGWQEVPATVIDLSEQAQVIAECDENLCGSNLTPAEVSMFTSKRKAAYEALHPEAAKPGPNRGKLCHNSFANDTAEKTGQSARKVRLDAERGDKVCEQALQMVQGTKLDTGRYIDSLKNLPPEKQIAKVQSDLKAKPKPKASPQSKIDADVKARAAKEVAEIIAEHVPGEWWDAVKANLYSAGAKNIANEFTNITGETVMDERYG